MKILKKIWNHISLFFSKIFLFFQKHLVDNFKEKVLTKKIIFTLVMMSIFIVIGAITVPGVKIVEGSEINPNDFFGILNTIGGGGLRRFSIVSLGISPFISASIIMTFAQTKLFPPIHQLSQAGPAGRIKINYITRTLTFVIAAIQAIMLTQSLQTGTIGFVELAPEFNQVWFIYIVLPFVMMAGSFLSVFISEQITNKGVGNGTSLLILSGTIISLPQIFMAAFNQMIPAGSANSQLLTGITYFSLYLLSFVVLMYLINFIYQAERKIPIQHIGSGRSRTVKELSYLPLKINAAGVMPVIFGMLTTSFPLMIINFIDGFLDETHLGILWFKKNFLLTAPVGLVIFSASIFIFTIIMGLQQARIDKIVEDFNRNSTFIPGIRPGEQTEDYLTSIVMRLSVFSAFYLTILASIEYLMQIAGVNPAIAFGGTSLMILVSVSIETMEQVRVRYKTSNFGKKESIELAAAQEVYNFDDMTRDVDLVNDDYQEDDMKNGSGSILW
ncbi:MAG: preprotein translocase subunit SecY [Mycoplasmataceae bacterium]|nr:preprotein translocase subunit SecY [Mycoplasmataceae bacterium]